MKGGSFPLVLFLILCFAAQGCAMGMTDNAKGATITGTLRVVGNEPLTHLVVTVEEERDGRGIDYLIVGPLEKELRDRYQGKKVTLQGKTCSSPLPQFKKCFRPWKIMQGRQHPGPR
jgi:hypothetical protein